MNLNFIKLSAILQLITIQNSSDGNKYQTTSNKQASKI